MQCIEISILGLLLCCVPLSLLDSKSEDDSKFEDSSTCWLTNMVLRCEG